MRWNFFTNLLFLMWIGIGAIILEQCIKSYLFFRPFSLLLIDTIYMGTLLFFVLLIFSRNNKKNAENDQLLNQNHLLLNSVSDGIYGIDKAGRIIFWSKAAERMTGYSTSEMIGKEIHHLIHHTKPDGSPYPLHDCPILNFNSSQSTYTISNEVYWRKDGTCFPVEYTVTHISSSDQIVKTVVNFRDVTNELKTQELLRKSDKQAVVGQLAAGVAHEIRNPLTVLKGFSKLIRTRYEGSEIYVDLILKELDHIEFIVNEFLFISRPQIMEFQRRQFHSIIKKVLPIMDTHAAMNNVQILYQQKILPDIYCDEPYLQQVIMNILKNAIEAMPTGGEIWIEEFFLSEKQQIKILFKDQGVGISNERLMKLGEPFYTTKEKGTGLGLMVCYKIIEMHKGELIIESEPGSGTEVCILLPVVQAKLEEEAG